MPETVTISELSARSGMAPSALRFYERRGLLRPIGRSGGKRIYQPAAIEQLALIDLLRQAGFSLTEIAGMIDHTGHVDAGWRAAARAKLTELEARIEFLGQAKAMVEHTLACPHGHLDDCPVFRSAVHVHAGGLVARAGPP